MVIVLKHTGRCVFNDDTVNIALKKAEEADGLFLALCSLRCCRAITSFLDRAFYAGKNTLNINLVRYS